MQVSAQLQSGDFQGQSAAVEFAPLDAQNLNELVEYFGEDSIFTHAKRSFVVSLQSFIRSQIESGKSQEEIQEACQDWKPGQKRAAKTPQEKIADLMAKLDPATRQALLKEYREKAKREAA